jgi:glycosyltransferase involved in cell wall biosynthesis
MNVMLGRSLGGLEQAQLDYHDALSRFGHDMHAVIHPDAAIRAEFEARHAVWHPLPHLGAWDLLSALRLRALLRRLRPDLSIAHGNRAMSLLRLAGAEPLAAVLPNYKIKCRGAVAALCPSLGLKQYAESQGIQAARAYHIPYMVAVPPAPPRRPSRREPPVVGTMGRFVAKKGFDVFIAALGLLRAQGVELRAILGGDGAERAALERQAGEAGLADVLSFPGWVTDKAAFFAGIDVFCLPSHHEPFGIVLLEAMAQAVPIVSTDSEGPSEILCDGTAGILVPRNDPCRLAEAIAALLGNAGHAEELATNAYRLARDSYDVAPVGAQLDSAVRRTVSLYRTAGESWRGGRGEESGIAAGK